MRTTAADNGVSHRLSSRDMADDVDVLNALLAKYRERDDGLVRVRAAYVIPDATNRASTGISLEHAHGIAMHIATKGYDDDHDVPGWCAKMYTR